MYYFTRPDPVGALWVLCGCCGLVGLTLWASCGLDLTLWV